MTSAAASPPTTWNYDRAELLADGVVHAIGLVAGIAGAVVLLAIVLQAEHRAEIAAAVIYLAGLLSMLAASGAYNVWPRSPVKWLLRRADHSAIFLLIAATYTPFLLHLKSAATANTVLAAVWLTAACGIALKLFWPGRFDRLTIALYLGLGWCGVLIYGQVAASLSATTLWLITIGGVIYSAGVVFHVWERLRFHNAIWHSFVLGAASVHYTAVALCLTAQT